MFITSPEFRDDFVNLELENVILALGREVAWLRFPIGGENRGVRPLLRIQATGAVAEDDEWGSEKDEWTGEGIATALGEEEKIKEPSGLRRSRHCSNGMTLGMERNYMFAGLGSEPMKLSHSSVTTKVMRISSPPSLPLETRSLQRFIMGLTCPRPGYGIATTWHLRRRNSWVLLVSGSTQSMPGIESLNIRNSTLQLWKRFFRSTNILFSRLGFSQKLNTKRFYCVVRV
ncbi:hypothetical protein NE237_014346 [Protea cynaroides]|uniref:Uncharacterized protein n=1 Tax=Protea cynaroides TaxID=273540 RepID=A0A9Q0QPW9_9MAGN|nr:hypothetical protein NE237_014346 [Protea cynaroides]